MRGQDIDYGEAAAQVVVEAHTVSGLTLGVVRPRNVSWDGNPSGRVCECLVSLNHNRPPL